MKERPAAILLADILNCIDKISAYTEGLDEAAFLQSDIVQDAVERNIGVIGEAVTKLQKKAPELIASTPNIPWHFARGMRHVIVHDYGTVNYSRVWQTIREDLPKFRAQIAALPKT